MFRLVPLRTGALALRTTLAPRTAALPSRSHGVAGAGPAAPVASPVADAASATGLGAVAMVQRRGFISGLVKKWKARLEADPEYQKSKKEWEEHLEKNPELKKKLDQAAEAAAKAKTAVATGAKVTASAVGTAAAKVGEGAEKLGTAVADSKAAEVVSKAADTLAQSAVGQTIGRVVDTTVRDLMREGTVYGTPKQIAASSPHEQQSAAAGGAQGSASPGAASGTSPSGTASTSTSASDAGSAAGTATESTSGASGDTAAHPNAQAVTARPRTAWERLAERIQQSNNPFLRVAFDVGSRVANVADKLGGLMSETEMAAVIREARKQDPAFTPDVFTRYVRSSIPLLFKAMGEGDVALLHEFTAGPTLKELTEVAMQRNAQGLKLDVRIMDIEHLELQSGTVVDDRLTLVVTSVLQQYECLRDKKGVMVPGSREEIRLLICVMGWTYLPTERRWKVSMMQLAPYG